MSKPLTILRGDCREMLKQLPSDSVHCCVTSPPYYALRSYAPDDHPDKAKEIGLEQTPAEFVATMVEVFREVRRVLRPDGTCWVNMGDSYAGNRRGSAGDKSTLEGSGEAQDQAAAARATTVSRRRDDHPVPRSDYAQPGFKPKDMMGIPWRLAFALQDDGWYLRQDIIWHKPNPMPESVGDRCTKSHEYLFLLAKSERYHFDADAIAEPVSGTANARKKIPPAGWQTGPGSHKPIDHQKAGGSHPKAKAAGKGIRANESFCSSVTGLVERRNKRSVWTIGTQGYDGAHFATFPEALVKPCILAGCPVGGTVLDPFGGSGTTGKVAIELGRKAVLVELYAENVKQIERRTTTTLGLALL